MLDHLSHSIHTEFAVTYFAYGSSCVSANGMGDEKVRTALPWLGLPRLAGRDVVVAFALPGAAVHDIHRAPGFGVAVGSAVGVCR